MSMNNQDVDLKWIYNFMSSVGGGVKVKFNGMHSYFNGVSTRLYYSIQIFYIMYLKYQLCQNNCILIVVFFNRFRCYYAKKSNTFFNINLLLEVIFKLISLNHTFHKDVFIIVYIKKWYQFTGT